MEIMHRFRVHSALVILPSFLAHICFQQTKRLFHAPRRGVMGGIIHALSDVVRFGVARRILVGISLRNVIREEINDVINPASSAARRQQPRLPQSLGVLL